MSMFFRDGRLPGMRLLMNKAGDGGDGGGGGEPNKELEALKTQNADLMKRLEALEKGGKKAKKVEVDEDEETDDDDDETEELSDKVKKKRETETKTADQTKALTSAIKFNHSSADFMKNNAALLPESIGDIFKMADKETFDSEIEKANQIRVGIVTEFFAVQANLDQLTPSQKNTLEEFLKLTKTVRQERVQSIYDSIFEPTLELIRKVKKAEALQKGLAPQSNTQDAYKKKLTDLSRKKWLGEKNA